jgi:hypothetical protein
VIPDRGRRLLPKTTRPQAPGHPRRPHPRPPSTAGWRPAPPQGEPWRPSPRAAPQRRGADPWADPRPRHPRDGNRQAAEANPGADRGHHGTGGYGDPPAGRGRSGRSGRRRQRALGRSRHPAPAGTAPTGGAGPAGGAAGGGSESWADPAPGTPRSGAGGSRLRPGRAMGVPPSWRAPTSGQWPAPPPAPPNWPPPPDAGGPSEPSRSGPRRRAGSARPIPSLPRSRPRIRPPPRRPTPREGPVAPPPMVETTEPPGHKRRWLFAGLGILAHRGCWPPGRSSCCAAAGADDNYVFGTGGRSRGDVMVHVGDEQPRPLEKGEDVKAGWVVEGAGSYRRLARPDRRWGRALRLRGHADLRRSRPVLGRRRRPDPAIQMDGGRTWINPAGAGKSADIGLDIPAAKVALTGNPVALDCTSTCTVEAPGGGVKVHDRRRPRRRPRAQREPSRSPTGPRWPSPPRPGRRPGPSRTSTPTLTRACPPPRRWTLPASRAPPWSTAPTP